MAEQFSSRRTRARSARPSAAAIFVSDGNVSSRTGIDMKGGTTVVGGDTGAFTGFMMQRGRVVICGNAGKNLGDSMYDGTIYIGASRRASARCGVGGDDRSRPSSGSSASSACTTFLPESGRRAASARSSPASNCGTTTISNRPRRNWCCKAREAGQRRKGENKNGKGNGARSRPRRSASFWARARSSRLRSSTTSM